MMFLNLMKSIVLFEYNYGFNKTKKAQYMKRYF